MDPVYLKLIISTWNQYKILIIYIPHSVFHIKSLKPSIIQSNHISSAQWPYVAPEVDGTDKEGLTKITVLSLTDAQCILALIILSQVLP